MSAKKETLKMCMYLTVKYNSWVSQTFINEFNK